MTKQAYEQLQKIYENLWNVRDEMIGVCGRATIQKINDLMASVREEQNASPEECKPFSWESFLKESGIE